MLQGFDKGLIIDKRFWWASCEHPKMAEFGLGFRGLGGRMRVWGLGGVWGLKGLEHIGWWGGGLNLESLQSGDRSPFRSPLGSLISPA